MTPAGSFAILLLLTVFVGYCGHSCYSGMQGVDDRVVKADDVKAAALSYQAAFDNYVELE